MSAVISLPPVFRSTSTTPSDALLDKAAAVAAGRYWHPIEGCTGETIIRDALALVWAACTDDERPNFTRAVFLGGCRHDLVSLGRWYAMLRMRRELGLSTGATGRIMQRDHTTVMYGLKQARRVEAWLTDVGHGRWQNYPIR